MRTPMNVRCLFRPGNVQTVVYYSFRQLDTGSAVATRKEFKIKKKKKKLKTETIENNVG